jgi:hypothetical protein
MHDDRDETIRLKIDDLGRKSFPDEPDVDWQVRRIVHADTYSFVEAEPIPATLGYPKFMFVLSFAMALEPAVVGCYCLDRGLWRLLFSMPNLPSDWIGLFPTETSEGFETDLLPLLQQGKKIEAIKVYRERTGAGLREAKDAVEAIAGKHGLALSKAGCAGLIVLLSGVLVCLVCLFASTAFHPNQKGNGLKTQSPSIGPDTKFMRANIEQLEQFQGAN